MMAKDVQYAICNHISKQQLPQLQTLPVQVVERIVLPANRQVVSVARSTLHPESCELVVVDLVTSVLSSVEVVSVDDRQLEPFLR